MREKTLSIIKPDGTSRALIGNIISRFESKGLKIVGLKMKQLSKSEAEGFYEIHKDKQFYRDLVAFMTSGPVVLMVIDGDMAIAKTREIMGATDPQKAAPGSIRHDFAKSVRENTVHGSDTKENALREIAFFFKPDEILEG